MTERNEFKEDNFCPHCNPCRHAERLDELDALRGVMVGLASRYGNGPGGGEFTTLEDMTERITEGVDTIIEVEKKRSLSDSSFRWIPVSERMPPAVPRSTRSWAFDDDRQFLARNSAGYCACVTAIYRDLDGSLGGECATPEATRDVIGDVAEWAPLPEAPKEG